LILELGEKPSGCIPALCNSSAYSIDPLLRQLRCIAHSSLLSVTLDATPRPLLPVPIDCALQQREHYMIAEECCSGTAENRYWYGCHHFLHFTPNAIAATNANTAIWARGVVHG